MPTVWFALKKSLHCKSEPSDVCEPKSKGLPAGILTRKVGRSGCSRSIANLRDVIHGGKGHLEKPANCSPRSIGSSEFVNPVTHQVILSDSKCELKITGYGGCHEGGGGGLPAGLGALHPGTPGPGGGGHQALHHSSSIRGSSTTPPRNHVGVLAGKEAHLSGGSALTDDVPGNGGVGGGGRVVHEGSAARRPSKKAADSDGLVAAFSCHRCGGTFGKREVLEAHHLSKHAVSELLEGDSSRKIVEIICRTSWQKPENNCGGIERVLKVHNMQKTLVRFEEYRETVKLKASKLPKKHPRCLADGNELLRFYGTTVACSLGVAGCSSLCVSERCSVCRIIRHGFSTGKESKGGIGVFTTSTSGRAFESVEVHDDQPAARKALLLCRVIAGRVHRPVDDLQELGALAGFDSLAGKVGLHANIEELYLLNPRALLPCFVVICKT